MRKSRFNESQRQAIIDCSLSGKKTVEAICEDNQISPATIYKWKNEVEVDKHEDKRCIPIAMLNGLCPKPKFSRTKNIGYDGSGVHNVVNTTELASNFVG
jgi:hypothetical protein